MSEGTMFKISMATVASVGVAFLSLIITVMMFWVGGISDKTDANSTDIASLKQCISSMKDTTGIILLDVKETKDIVTGIRLSQAEHYGMNKKKVEP
jgi:uncharacterized membrane protein